MQDLNDLITRLFFRQLGERPKGLNLTQIAIDCVLLDDHADTEFYLLAKIDCRVGWIAARIINCDHVIKKLQS